MVTAILKARLLDLNSNLPYTARINALLFMGEIVYSQAMLIVGHATTYAKITMPTGYSLQAWL